jgi:hypothetical protein
MKRVKEQGPSPIAEREMDKVRRLEMIESLAGNKMPIVPLAEYCVEYHGKDFDLSIKENGIVYETGYKSNLVRVLVRPELSPKMVISALFEVCLAIGKREANVNWIGELTAANTQAHERASMLQVVYEALGLQ